MNCTKPRERVSRTDISAFILRRVQAKAALPKNADLARFDYIDAGLIDSIGMIKFIMDIEMAFDIAVTEDDLISEQFRTIEGLVSLIAGKCA